MVDRSRSVAHPALERVIAELAAKFVTVAPNHLDETLVESLQRIAETLDLDRGVLWRFTDGNDELLQTHSWIRPELHSYPSPTSVSVRESFPWMFSKLRANELIWNDRLSDMTECADRHNLVRFGTRSNAAIPLIAEGAVIGVVSFGAVRGERTWTPEIRERLELMARVFALALARRQTEQRLEQALTNVDELRRRQVRDNALLRLLAHGPRFVAELPVEDTPPESVAPPSSATLADVQVSHIRRVLEQVRWRVRGKGGAAEVLGMKPTTLDSRMARLGITRPRR